MTTGLRAFVSAAAACVASAVLAVSAATEGAEVGKWTMDAEAATALAKEKRLPLFINFTGSDWCHWCQLLDREVFDKPAWQDYAAKHLVLLWLDFPQDKSRVPEKYVKQNETWRDKYGIEGYPTCVVLDPDGKELGRLGASRDVKAEGFVADTEDVLLKQRIARLLSPEDYKAFQQAEAELKALMERVSETREQWIRASREVAVRFQKELDPLIIAYRKNPGEETKKVFDEGMKALNEKFKPDYQKVDKKFSAIYDQLGKERTALEARLDALRAKARANEGKQD